MVNFKQDASDAKVLQSYFDNGSLNEIVNDSLPNEYTYSPAKILTLSEQRTPIHKEYSTFESISYILEPSLPSDFHMSLVGRANKDADSFSKAVGLPSLKRYISGEPIDEYFFGPQLNVKSSREEYDALRKQKPISINIYDIIDADLTRDREQKSGGRNWFKNLVENINGIAVPGLEHLKESEGIIAQILPNSSELGFCRWVEYSLRPNEIKKIRDKLPAWKVLSKLKSIPPLVVNLYSVDEKWYENMKSAYDTKN